MSDEHEWAEMADMALMCVRECINLEDHFVHETHELLDHVMMWGHVVAHLDELIESANRPHLHELNGQITDKLLEIQDLVESGKLQGLRIIREEQEDIKHLTEEIKHREWKLVRASVIKGATDEEAFLNLEHHEIKKLHKLFHNLVELMKESEHMPPPSEEYEKTEDRLFHETHKFCRAYERIFRHLMHKEKKMVRKTKKLM
ncbi:hypothetical protein GOV10_00740 [Candidatus Woesearchaeota archaeon]|nr:hypothetical protein [Candidatus Woesearchaeota archaeon]